MVTRRTITPSVNHESETSELEENLIDPFYASTFQREPSFEELIRELQKLTSDDLEDIQEKKTVLLFQKVLSTLGLKLSKINR